MWDEVFKWITGHFPVLALVIVAVAASIFITNKVNHWLHRIKQTEDDCAKIDGHLMPQLRSINSSLTILNGSFNSLVVYLKGKDGQMDTSLFVSKSPIQLTDLGWRVLQAIGGQDYIDKNVDLLIKAMDEQRIRTALDSQTYAPIIINKASSEALFNEIKNYVFKNPYYKETNGENEISVPLDLGTITNIMGIYLRDKYLERHPELNPSDIPSPRKTA